MPINEKYSLGDNSDSTADLLLNDITTLKRAAASHTLALINGNGENIEDIFRAKSIPIIQKKMQRFLY